MMKKTLLLIAFLCGVFTMVRGDNRQGELTDGQVIRLYQGKAPGTEKWKHQEVTLVNTSNPITFNVVEPTMKVYLPEHPNGTAMVVCPGGGFCMLSIRTEGELVAQKLAKQGVTAFVLKYRTNPMLMKDGRAPKNVQEFIGTYLPITEVCKQQFKDKHNGQDPTVTEWCSEVPYQKMAFDDANQAMKLIRRNAGKWSLNADKIGIMGFSAGAIISMHQTLFNTPETQPNFTGIIYGGWTPDVKIPAGAGPVWLCSPVNDIFGVEEPENIYHAWRAAKLPTELHTFWDCNHGFGGSTFGKNVDNWMSLMIGFMKDVKFLPD
jgi:dienelactone hydrolase